MLMVENNSCQATVDMFMNTLSKKEEQILDRVSKHILPIGSLYLLPVVQFPDLSSRERNQGGLVRDCNGNGASFLLLPFPPVTTYSNIAK